MAEPTLLVTGASGKLGQQVIHHLLQTLRIAPDRLIVTTRSTTSSDLVAQWQRQGVRVRLADFDQPAQLASAFTGADHLLLISTNAPNRAEQQQQAVQAAQAAGVKHLVYTSMPNPTKSPIVFAHEHAATEQAIQASTIPAWTILRNNWYFDNLLDFQRAVLETGFWLSAARAGQTAQIARSDLGLAAAQALVQGGTEQQTLTLSGPQNLTTAEMAEQINQVLGLTVQVIPVDNATYQAKLREFQVPEPFVAILASMEEHNAQDLSAGDPADFIQLTGRQPMTFQQWLEQNKAVLIK